MSFKLTLLQIRRCAFGRGGLAPGLPYGRWHGLGCLEGILYILPEESETKVRACLYVNQRADWKRRYCYDSVLYSFHLFAYQLPFFSLHGCKYTGNPISCKVCTTYMKKYVSCLVNGGDFEECVDTPQDEILHEYVTLGGEKRVCMSLDILMMWLYKVWETRWGVCSLP